MSLNGSAESRGRKSFRIRLGLLVNKLYAELYGKKPRKVRSSTKPKWRNNVCQYPCGILEQAYRELKAEPLHDTLRDAQALCERRRQKVVRLSSSFEHRVNRGRREGVPALVHDAALSKLP